MESYYDKMEFKNKINRNSILIGCDNSTILEYNYKVLKTKKINFGACIKTILKLYENIIIGSTYFNFALINSNYDYENPLILSLKQNYFSDVIKINDYTIAIATDSPTSLTLFSLDQQKLHSVLVDETQINTLCKVDELHVLGGCKDGSIFSWNIQSNKLESKLQAHSSYVNSILKLNSGHGAEYASSGHDESIKLWNLENKINLREVSKNKMKYSEVAHNFFSKLKELNDGRLIYGNKNNFINMWDLRSFTMSHRGTFRYCI